MKERKFYGPFAKIRESLDFSWHGNYTPERQEWQDNLVQSVFLRTQKQPRPWIIYTGGPMGAGKGYTLAWMSENG